MAYTPPEIRHQLITGLRALAEFLETHPEVPAPAYLDAMVFIPEDTDEQMRAEVARIAGLIGSQIDPESARHGHYCTVVDFGPVQYRAVAILADARDRHEARTSYYDVVVPDMPQEI